MSGAARLWVPVGKEFRALAYPWLATLTAMLPAVVVGSPRFASVTVVAYLLGAATMGAMSIGHEYTDRTLGSLLSLPARRERLLASKLAVLAVMLGTLGGAAYVVVFRRSPAMNPLAWAALPALYGLFVAPCLTMATRNPIAGAVFTLAVPAELLLVIGRVLRPVVPGNGPDAFAFEASVLVRGSLLLCAVAAVASWSMFKRLEAVDGRGQDLRMPGWLWRRSERGTGPAGGRARRPAWLLVAKELRLQQMTLFVAGLVAAGWVAAAPVREALPVIDPRLFGFLFAMVVASLASSFASAEERRMGTLEWQLLLPVSASVQWAIKVATVVGLTLLLGFGVPAAVSLVLPLPQWTSVMKPATSVLIVVCLCASGLYVSSLCRSGLWALVMLFPSAAAATWFGAVLDRVHHATWVFSVRALRMAAYEGSAWIVAVCDRIERVGAPVLFIGLAIVAFRLALSNHRFAAWSPGRVVRQVALLAAIAVAGVVVLGVVYALHTGGYWLPE